ncbi:MAG: tail protein X [Candidatus Aegiribacteria sp.]
MKNFNSALPVLAILLAGTIFSVSAVQVHHIRYGDTLWELSIQYYGTPFHWEDILRANPTVEGVEYLRPGTDLTIPDVMDDGTVDRGSLHAGGIYITSTSSSRPMLSRLVLETAGMVTDAPPQPSGYVIDVDIEEEDPFEDINAYPGDLVALDIGSNDGVGPDMIYTIYRSGEEISHPENGNLMGNAYRVAGICRIVDTDPTSSVAMVEHSYLPISYGDFLVPYSREEHIPVTTSETVDQLDAYVLAFRDPDMERVYSYDVIYIDRGSADGLNPGDVYKMFKYGRQIESPDGSLVDTPDVPVCDLIVLDARQNTSSAMIYSIGTSDLVRVGDRIELARRQL